MANGLTLTKRSKTAKPILASATRAPQSSTRAGSVTASKVSDPVIGAALADGRAREYGGGSGYNLKPTDGPAPAPPATPVGPRVSARKFTMISPFRPALPTGTPGIPLYEAPGITASGIVATPVNVVPGIFGPSTTRPSRPSFDVPGGGGGGGIFPASSSVFGTSTPTVPGGGAFPGGAIFPAPSAASNFVSESSSFTSTGGGSSSGVSVVGGSGGSSPWFGGKGSTALRDEAYRYPSARSDEMEDGPSSGGGEEEKKIPWIPLLLGAAGLYLLLKKDKKKR